MTCPRCGHEYGDELEKCPVCGLPNNQQSSGANVPVNLNKSAHGHQQSSGNAQEYLYEIAPPPNDAGGAKPSTVLALGILSFGTGVAGFVLGLLAMIWGARARTMYPVGDPRQTMASAGWILGIIGAVVQCIMLVMAVSVMSYLSQLTSMIAMYS